MLTGECLELGPAPVVRRYHGVPSITCNTELGDPLDPIGCVPAMSSGGPSFSRVAYRRSIRFTVPAARVFVHIECRVRGPNP